MGVLPKEKLANSALLRASVKSTNRIRHQVVYVHWRALKKICLFANLNPTSKLMITFLRTLLWFMVRWKNPLTLPGLVTNYFIFYFCLSSLPKFLSNNWFLLNWTLWLLEPNPTEMRWEVFWIVYGVVCSNHRCINPFFFYFNIKIIRRISKLFILQER